MKTIVQLVICDLDNTLYDWVTFFSRAFYAMIDTAARLLGVTREQLLDELQTIHRRHHSSEQPFALLEAPSATKRFPRYSPRELRDALKPAFEAFNTERRRSLCLYPGVRETLSAAQHEGATVVAHTEATIVNASYRLSMLGLTRYFAKLYAVEHSNNLHPAPERSVPIETVPGIRILMVHERKPDIRVLLEICKDAGVVPSEAVYVGDSLPLDIGMANSAGVHSAWAKYGTRYEPEAWERVVRISHWSAEEVAKAKRVEEAFANAVPDVILEQSMNELLDHFKFARHRPR